MEEAILRIGAENFPRVLFKALRDIAPIQQLSIFRSDGEARIEALAAESVGDVVAAREEIQAHLERSHAPGDGAPGPTPMWQVGIQFIDAEAAGAAPIRRPACCRAAVVIRRPEDSLVVDLLGPPGMEGFTDEAKRRLVDCAGAVASAVQRHFELMRPSVRPSLSAWSRQMQRLPGLPPLSSQEAVVCAHILEGHSNKTIALDEGISVHSVVTYRRRAYSKLNITSLNELFSLMLRARGGDPDGRGPSEAPRRLGLAESFVP